MLLTKDQILNAEDTKSQAVNVKEWGGTVRVRMMTGTERDQFEREQYELMKIGKMGDNMRARLVARCVVDEDGQQLFTPDDVAALGGKSAIALDRIVKAISSLNKLDTETVENLAKNSDPSPGASS